MNRLPVDYEKLAELCRRNHIRSPALIGSALRGEDRPDSEVDLLVEFDPGEAAGLPGMASIEKELSVMLGGRRVDLAHSQGPERALQG